MPVGTGVDSTMAVLVGTLNSFVQKNIAPTVYDQVLKHNPVLYRFWKRGQKLGGGAALTWPVMTSAKQFGGWYLGAKQLAHGVEDTSQSAQVNWRHGYEDVTIPYTDLLLADGPEAKVDLIKFKFDEAVMNLRSRVSQALYASGDPVDSLDHFFQAIDDGVVDAFATYAGIAHSNAFWQPGVSALAITDKANAAVASLSEFQTIYGACSDGDEQPTLLIVRQAGFNFVWGQLQAQQRFTKDDEMTQAGFEAFKFNRSTVVVDNNTKANSALFLNEHWVDLVSHKKNNFLIQPIIPATVSELSLNTKVTWSGNLRVKIVRYQGKITRGSNL